MSEKENELTGGKGGDGPVVLRLDPDLGFIKTISAWGGGDLKSCFQCATCAVVCPLSPDVQPFPRKEIVWAQWGLADRLAADPDLWLCHRCNDCSQNCPRGAKTGDVMAALRSFAYQHNAWPRFLGRWLNRPLMLPVLLAFPALVIWAIVTLGGTLAAPAGLNAELHSQYWGNLIEPWPWLDLTFIFAALFVVLSFSLSVGKLWRGFGASGVQEDLTPKRGLLSFGVSIGRLWGGFGRSGLMPEVSPRMPIGEALQSVLGDILAHRRFDDCGPARPRRLAHMLILFGFGGLFLTTALVFVGMYVFGLKTPLPLGHWIKVLGNASALCIAAGLVWAIVRRANSQLGIDNGRTAYQDLLFLCVMTLVVLSGIAAEVFRLATAHELAALSYLTHLVFIFFLIFYAPFSKFAHVVYHTTALTWARHVGRELKTLEQDLGIKAAAADRGHGDAAAA